MNFANHNVEGLGDTRLRRVLAVDDGVVHHGTSRDIVGLDGEEFLQRVSGTVSFHGPHFHFTEALATELALTAERLLRHEGVATDRTGVDLVVHQVAELEVVHVTDGHRVQEGFAGTAVIELGLTDDLVVFRIHGFFW